MPYVEGREVYDADSHVVEPPGWLDDRVEPAILARLNDVLALRHRNGLEFLAQQKDKFQAFVESARFSRGSENLMDRKLARALGAFIKEDRPLALDELGFRGQLVFTSGGLGYLRDADQTGDAELAYTFAAAVNRWLLDFCAVDERLFPVCFVPLCDLERAPRAAEQALEAGARALLLASRCPAGHGITHVALDPIWAMAQEAGVPIVFHVGGTEDMTERYYDNGRPPIKGMSGGDVSLTSTSFVGVPFSTMQTLTVLVMDGILEQFPDLKIGVMEEGAWWLPGLMWTMDMAARSFREARLGKLTLKPSEYLQRQLRVTPFSMEPVDTIVELVGPDMCMFSSDYPHIEGGRDPLKHFDRKLEQCSAPTREKFFGGTFKAFLGLDAA